MPKFWYLVRHALAKRAKTKAFVISNILIALLVIGMANLTNIIDYFSSDEEKYKTVLVYDETTLNQNAITYLEQALIGQGYGQSIEISLHDEPFNQDEAYTQMNDYTAVLHIYYNEEKLAFDMYTNGLDVQTELLLNMAFNQVQVNLWLENNPEHLKVIEDFLAPVELNVFYPEGTDPSAEMKNTILGVISSVILFPVFMLLMILMQFVGMDILEEKSSRAIEVIISNVPTAQHFFAKILSSIVFLLIQGTLLFIYGFIGAFIAFVILGAGIENISDLPAQIGEMTNMPAAVISSVIRRIPAMVAVLAVFTFLGFIFYLVFIAVFSSMATNMEDFQQFQTPVMLLLLAGFYSALFSTFSGGSSFIKVMGYIPLFSPMLAPVLFINGTFGPLDVLFSAGLLLLLNAIIIYFGLPIYKVSILSFSQDSFFKRIKKLVRRSKYSD